MKEKTMTPRGGANFGPRAFIDFHSCSCKISVEQSNFLCYLSSRCYGKINFFQNLLIITAYLTINSNKIALTLPQNYTYKPVLSECANIWYQPTSCYAKNPHCLHMKFVTIFVKFVDILLSVRTSLSHLPCKCHLNMFLFRSLLSLIWISLITVSWDMHIKILIVNFDGSTLILTKFRRYLISTHFNAILINMLKLSSSIV